MPNVADAADRPVNLTPAAAKALPEPTTPMAANDTAGADKLTIDDFGGRSDALGG